MSEVNPLSDDWFHSVASQFELLCCCALLWLLPEAETSNAQEDHCSVIGHLFLVQDLQLVKAHDCIELGVPLWKAWSVFIYLAFFMFALSGVLFCFVFNNLCSPDLGKTMYKNILKVNGWILTVISSTFVFLRHAPCPADISLCLSSPLSQDCEPLPLKITSYFLHILTPNHLAFGGLHTSLWR